MRLSLAALTIAGGLALCAAPAAAQHCWPSAIALRVHDGRGDLLDPAGLKITYRPRTTREVDFSVERREISVRGEPNQPVPALVWSGRGACTIDIREVVIRQRGAVLRLWMVLHVDTQANPVPSQFVLDTPPLADGTWRLDVCRLPRGDAGGFVQIPLVWVRVSTSGNPHGGWQPPFGCERDRAR